MDNNNLINNPNRNTFLSSNSPILSEYINI